MIELVVTLSIFGIMAATAMPMWKSSQTNILTARRMVSATLRLARTNAITKSVHYQVAFPDAGHVSISAMTLNGGNWVVDTTKVQTRPLPSGTQPSLLGTKVEFNTRGMVANSSTLTQITVTDSFSKTKSLQVWPSGQINEM